MVSPVGPVRNPLEFRLSVIIPVHNGASTLDACLRSLSLHGGPGLQVIVIDDASTDDSASIAIAGGVEVLKVVKRRGPAFARNLGVTQACGEIILFLDADVLVLPDTIPKVRARFSADSGLAALMGSYDDAPAEPGVVSQYRNLLHCFTHRTGNSDASTFWTGCGAIRREVFLELGGFDTGYLNASIEDIELGYRLRRQSRRVMLDPEICVKHLKRWKLLPMLRTDILHRGIPWTRLILREGAMPNDLNLRTGQRYSVLLAYLLLGLLTASVAELIWQAPALWIRWTSAAATVALGSLLLVNRRFYWFLAEARGWLFVAAAMPLHFAYLLCNGISFLWGLASHVWDVAFQLLEDRATSQKKA